MRIATIITVFNTERYVAQALDSVLAQTRRSDEIVVVDDGSTDGTPAVLRRYASCATIITQQNTGPARALNAAIAVARGDALAFLDADDLWVRDKLRLQSAALAAQGELEAVFGHIEQFVSPDCEPGMAQAYDVPTEPQPGISKNTCLIRRAAFERVGRFDESLTASDFVDWYARASAMGLRTRMLPEVVARRRHHAGNMGRVRRDTQRDELLATLKRTLDMRRRSGRV